MIDLDTRKIDVSLTEEQFEARRKEWKPPASRYGITNVLVREMDVCSFRYIYVWGDMYLRLRVSERVSE